MSGPAGGRRALSLVSAVSFCDFYALSSFFLLPRHLKELGAGEDYIGVVMGATSAVNLLAIPLAGVLVDRWGRRPLLIFGSILMALTSEAFVPLHALGPGFAVLRGLHGIAFASFFVSGMALVADVAPPDRRAYLLGLYGMFNLITHALAPALGEAIVAAAGFPWLFHTAAGAAVVATAISLFLPALPAPVGARPPASVGALARRRDVWAPVFMSAVLATGFGGAIQFIAAFAVVRGLGPVAPFFLSFVATSVAVRVFGGRHFDRIGAREVTVWAGFLYAAAVAALGGATGPWWLVACGAAFGVAQGVTYPALSAVVIGRVEPCERGRAVGLYSGAFGGGMLASALGYGALAEVAGYPAMYLVAGGVMAAGTTVFVLIDRS